MDIFAYTLPDRIKCVFSALHDELGRQIKLIQEFYISINRGYSSDKYISKQHQYHRDALTELLTCINEMIDYISSISLTLDSDGLNVLTPLTDSLTALIKHYDHNVR